MINKLKKYLKNNNIKIIKELRPKPIKIYTFTSPDLSLIDKSEIKSIYKIKKDTDEVLYMCVTNDDRIYISLDNNIYNQLLDY